MSENDLLPNEVPWGWYRGDDLDAGDANKIETWIDRSGQAGTLVVSDHPDRFLLQVDEGIGGYPSARQNDGWAGSYLVNPTDTSPSSSSWTFAAMIEKESAGIRWELRPEEISGGNHLSVSLTFDFFDDGVYWYFLEVESASGVGWSPNGYVRFTDDITEGLGVVIVLDASNNELRLYGNGEIAQLWGGGDAVFGVSGPFSSPDTEAIILTVYGNDPAAQGVGLTLFSESIIYPSVVDHDSIFSYFACRYFGDCPDEPVTASTNPLRLLQRTSQQQPRAPRVVSPNSYW